MAAFPGQGDPTPADREGATHAQTGSGAEHANHRFRRKIVC